MIGILIVAIVLVGMGALFIPEWWNSARAFMTSMFFFFLSGGLVYLFFKFRKKPLSPMVKKIIKKEKDLLQKIKRNGQKKDDIPKHDHDEHRWEDEGGRFY